MTQPDSTIEKLKEAYNLLCSNVDAPTVYDTLRHDEDVVDPEELFFDGDYYCCPDDRCSMKETDSGRVEEHVQITHDRGVREHFIDHIGTLKLMVDDRITHLERLQKYRERLDQDVMELDEFKDSFEHGLAVCAICGSGFKKMNDANEHKREGHNVWIRRLETSYNDPKVS